MTVFTRGKNSGMLLLEVGDATMLVKILCEDSPVLTISDIYQTPFPLADDIDPDEVVIDDAQWLPHRAADIMSGKRLKKALEVTAERLSRKVETDVEW